MISICVLAFAVPAPAVTQSLVEPLPIREVVETVSFSSRTPVQMSPDGEWVAYTVHSSPRIVTLENPFSDTGVPQEAFGTQVHVVHTSTGESRALLDGAASSWAPVWSPAGDFLAFYSDLGGEANLWVWDRAHDHARPVSDQLVRPSWPWEIPRWTPDGRALVVKVLPEDWDLAEANLRARRATPEPKTGEDLPTVRVFDRSTAHPRGNEAPQGIPDWFRWRYGGDLAIIEIESGAVDRLVGGHIPQWWSVSPDGEWLAFTHTTAVREEPAWHTVKSLAAVPLQGGRIRTLDSSVFQRWGVGISWAPDGLRLGYISEPPGQAPGFYVAEIAGGSAHRIADARPGWGHAYTGPLWSGAGDFVYFSSSGQLWSVSPDSGEVRVAAAVPDRTIVGLLARHADGRIWESDGTIVLRTRDSATGAQGFWRADPSTGQTQKLIEEKGSFGTFFTSDVAADGTAAVIAFSDAQTPMDLWTTGPDLNRSQRLTQLNPHFDRYSLGAAQSIEWTTGDGNRLGGTLLLPPGHTNGEPLPLIVDVYGGSLGSLQLNVFDRGRQLLASHGYAILVPDAPTRVGSPMSDIAEAVLPGVERLVELGIADPNRIGVFGHSYGGYSALALITLTEVFRAAVASASVSNLISAYGHMSDRGVLAGPEWTASGQGRMDGSPWEFLDRYIDNSPYFSFNEITTPVLLLHGSADDTTPPYLAIESYTALVSLGHRVKLALYEGESHSWPSWRVPNQIDYWQRILDWFAEHL